MKDASRFLSAVILVSLAVVMAWPLQAISAEFTADLIRSSGGDEDMSKVFVKGKLRREELMEDGEVAAISIARLDKGVNWNLMPEEKMYMEISLDPGASESKEDMESLDSVAKMVSIGNRKITYLSFWRE